MTVLMNTIQLLFLFIVKKSVLAFNTGYTSPLLPTVNKYEQPLSSESYFYNSAIETSLALPFVNAFEDNLSNVLTYDPPLFLTPYIESGEIEQGRLLSRVAPLPNAPYVPSYSGFFTVNKEYNSNLFFWFFPALNNDINAPILLWLQGGPGATGLMGLFVEHGPYILYSNTTAGLRQHTWANEFNVIYIDSPVGAGFSFTDNENGYATNEDQVTNDLYSFLEQFFRVYYEYRYRDFYILGESYGGKHVPYLGYKIHLDGPPAEINFKGIAFGNGFIDLNNFRGFGNFLYELGIVDSQQAAFFESSLDLTNLLNQNGEYLLAIHEFNKIYGIFKVIGNATSSYLFNVSGYDFYYNFQVTHKPEDYTFYEDYIQSTLSRNAIHVGNLKFHGEDIVQHYLLLDIPRSSSKDKIAVLMDNYKVLIYNGQLDLAIPHVLTMNLLQDLPWKHLTEYKTADRKIWKLENTDHIAGYVRSVGNFREVLVRNAGHLVPHDQPQAARELITKFIKDLPY